VLYGAVQVAGDPGDGPDTARDRLYGRFVEYAFRRKSPSSSCRPTPHQLMLRRLGWLAKQMEAPYQTDFQLGDLDLMWLERTGVLRGRLPIAIVIGIASGLVAGLLGGFELGQVVGWSSFVGYLALHPLWFALPRLAVRIARTDRVSRGRLAGLIPLIRIATDVVINGVVFSALGALARRSYPSLSFGADLGLLAAAITAVESTVLQIAIRFRRSSWMRIVREDQRQPWLFVHLRSTYWTFVQVLSPLTAFIVLSKGPVAGLFPERLAHLVLPLTAVDAITGAGLPFIWSYIVRGLLPFVTVAPFSFSRFLDEATERLFMVRRCGFRKF
jgi:hypothetical protein